MLEESPEVETEEVVEQYKTNTEEQQTIIEEIQSTIVVPEDEIEIVRTESAQEDVDVIVEALKQKILNLLLHS